MTDGSDHTDPAYPGAPRSARTPQDNYRDLSTDDLEAMTIAGTDTESGATSKDPDQIRREIERTRSELGSNVDALADKVTPSKIMQRQTGKIRSALGSVSERVMGQASQASDAASELSQGAVQQVKGNPMTVGLIAFGVGWLAASLVPATAPEQRMAAQIKTAAAPLVDEAVGAAKSVGESLKEPAQNAAAAVKDAATEAVDTVKGEATDAKDAVKEQARRSANDVEL